MADAINPSHYKDGWSDGAELISITENLNFNGGNAVKYAARSCRLDASFNKGDLVEDLEKAIWYLTRELKRVKARKPVDTTIKINPNVSISGRYGFNDDYYRALAQTPRAFA